MKGNVRTSRVSLSRGNGLSTDSGGGVGGIAGYRLRNKTSSRGPGVSPVLRLCLLLLLISVLVWVAYMRTRKVTISSTTVVMENARIDTEEALTQRVPVMDIALSSQIETQPQKHQEPVLENRNISQKGNKQNNDVVGLDIIAQELKDQLDARLRNLESGHGSRHPVLGEPVASDAGAKPLFGFKHTGTDAVFALACNYPVLYYRRFVGSLRKAGYIDDIVLAVSPPEKMRAGVENYLREQHVLSYAFEVDCQGKDNCRLKDDFLGYPDPRPMRTFANIRYALYEFWLRYYDTKSYILILDFRDTFFQLDPFVPFGPFASRLPKYNLHLYAENWDVKNIGKCVYNSLWIGRCFSKKSLQELRGEAVICSGSTLGSFLGIDHYITTMLTWMDKVQCWLKGIESDQGYQNFLYYKGHFNSSLGDAILNYQGNGVVNTIGAMNGKRVPIDKKGPLDSFWNIKDGDGYILNNDGTRSACVHQWDRFYLEIQPWLDITLMQIKGVRNETRIWVDNEARKMKKKVTKLKI